MNFILKDFFNFQISFVAQLCFNKKTLKSLSVWGLQAPGDLALQPTSDFKLHHPSKTTV
jgi:hypothetical protein